MLPSSSELQYFLEVASTLNISRAAERLGISQPTLSLAMQRLEENFGTPLLIRSRSGVKLTHAGQRFLAKARDLVHGWDQVRSETLKHEQELAGRYVLGCHPSVALYSLHTFLPDLLENHRLLELKLVHDLSRRITEDIISFKIDLGIVVNPWPHPDLVIRPLFLDQVSLWTAKQPSDLQEPRSGRAVLLCDPDLVQTQALLRQMDKEKMAFERTFTSSNLEVIASLVGHGAGVGILPGRVATRSRELGLVPFSKSAPKYSDRICLVYRADLQKSRASRSLMQCIEQSVGAAHHDNA